MLQGIHLTLLIGPAVPVPAPEAVMDAITSVQVTSSKDTSGFQLVFAVSKNSLLLTTLLPAGYFDPVSTRVIVIATVGGLPQVLMDGVVTRQELAPSSEPGQSTLTITGEDLSALMDLIDLTGVPFPAMPEPARVMLMLAKYAVFGIVPIAIPPIPPDWPLPTAEIPTQRGTDRAYIRSMASDAGYVFYVEPGPLPGQSIAYFGPDIRLPVPQPALNINMDADTNVDSLSFSFDGLQKKTVLYNIMDPITGKVVIPIPVPDISILRPPLGAKLPIPWRLEQREGAAKNNPAKAAQEILGILFNASDAITASGSLDVLRYGRVLRSRMLVGVRGAGIAYDGLYYVNSVTHSIKRGEYKQSFQLSRDGLISLTPSIGSMTEPAASKAFYGKYRGTVLQNVDPEFRGRLMCLVPDVLGVMPSNWCEVCAPLAGPTGAPMGVYMVPPIGAGVWVEFEQGDPGHPIWTGCRFGTGDVPPLALAGNPLDPNICIQSTLQHTLLISDMPPSPATGGIMLKSTTGAMIVVNDSGIYLSNGKGATMTMVGPTIDFNVGALTIT